MEDGNKYLNTHLGVALKNLEKKIDLLRAEKVYGEELANLKMIYELTLEQIKNENSSSTAR